MPRKTIITSHLTGAEITEDGDGTAHKVTLDSKNVDFTPAEWEAFEALSKGEAAALRTILAPAPSATHKTRGTGSASKARNPESAAAREWGLSRKDLFPNLKTGGKLPKDVTEKYREGIAAGTITAPIPADEPAPEVSETETANAA